MDLGRRQNADPRWILPTLCRRGHVSRQEIGAIRITPNETWFQVPRAIADKFADGTSLGRLNDLQADGRGGAWFTQGELYHAAADGTVTSERKITAPSAAMV